jgi:hypothetical protein
MNAITPIVDGNAAQSLREFNIAQTMSDPSRLSWPSSLPIELALKTASPQELRTHYGFSDEEWQALRENPVFIAELSAQCELMKKEGMGFKMKARLQAEAMLETSWRLAHAPSSEVPANVKADLIKTTWRVAGFDNKEAAAGTSAAQFNIQINL